MVDCEQFDSELLLSLPDTEFISATMLTGGLTNRCWKLTLFHPSINQTKQYVWRPFSAATQAFGIKRQYEYQLLTMITNTALAPKPLQLLCHSELSTPQALVVEWLVGTEANSCFSDNALCQLQAKVHQLPLPPWRLDVHQRAEHYWQHINSDHKTALLRSLYHFFQQRPLPAFFNDCCCHFDLGRYNVIVPDAMNIVINDAKIIDWEYAAAGDPSLDLAMTIIANGLDPEQAVSDYCDHRQSFSHTGFNKHYWLQAVIVWQPWCQYLALLWYLVGYDIWQQPEYLQHALQLQQQLIELMHAL